MKMKKFLAMLLAMVMCMSTVACGGSDEAAGTGSSDSDVTSESEGDESEGDESEGDDSEGSVTITDQNGEEVSQEKLEELKEAYNAIAVSYNEIATAANENGWMADEQTAAELDAVGTTLGFIGTGLTEDITMLDGSDFDTLIDKLQNELPVALEEMAERVSVPYEE